MQRIKTDYYKNIAIRGGGKTSLSILLLETRRGIFMYIMAGICLLIQGLWDVRTKEIPMWISICFGGCSFLYSICMQRSWTSILLALVPGVVCLMLGCVTRQAIGYGDGILITALGMLYSIEELLEICMVAMLFACAAGLILLIVFKKEGNYEIPFVPFLFMGWMMVYIIHWAGI